MHVWLDKLLQQLGEKLLYIQDFPKCTAIVSKLIELRQDVYPDSPHLLLTPLSMQ